MILTASHLEYIQSRLEKSLREVSATEYIPRLLQSQRVNVLIVEDVCRLESHVKPLLTMN